jgi:hypothetical protein
MIVGVTSLAQYLLRQKDEYSSKMNSEVLTAMITKKYLSECDAMYYIRSFLTFRKKPNRVGVSQPFT